MRATRKLGSGRPGSEPFARDFGSSFPLRYPSGSTRPRDFARNGERSLRTPRDGLVALSAIAFASTFPVFLTGDDHASREAEDKPG